MDCINLQCIFKSNNPQSVLSTSLVHQSGAEWYKVSRRWPKHNSERGNVERKLRNEQPFAIGVKGGGKEKRGFSKASRGSMFPSMPKGETVGNVFIDGKGKDMRST